MGSQSLGICIEQNVTLDSIVHKEGTGKSFDRINKEACYSARGSLTSADSSQFQFCEHIHLDQSLLKMKLPCHLENLKSDTLPISQVSTPEKPQKIFSMLDAH